MAGKGTSTSSLYAGIFNNKNRLASDSNDKQSSPINGSDSDNTTTASNPTSTNPGSNTSSSSQPAWSAALRFAPRAKTSATSKSAPNSRLPPKISASFNSREPDVQDLPSNDTNKASSINTSTAIGGGGWNRMGSAPTSSSSPTNDTPSNQVDQSTSQRSRTDQSSSNLNEKDNLKALTIPNQPISNSKAPPRNFHPPSLTLTKEELDKDKALIHAQKVALGEINGDERDDRDHYGSAGLGHAENHDRDRWEEDEGEGEDVNGFGDTREGKRSKKRKKRNRNGSPDHSTPIINYDVDYDFRIPNDYLAYKEIVKKRRQTKEMIRRKEVGEEDEMRGESEGYSRRGYNDHAPEYDSEEEEEKRRKMKRFAPPSSYSSSSRQESFTTSYPPPRPAQEPEEDLDALVPDASPSPSPPRPTFGSFSHNESSSTSRPQQPGAPSFVSASSFSAAAAAPPPPSFEPPAPPNTAETGEEAYARRVAMSQASSGEEAYQRRLAMSQGNYQTQPPSNQFTSHPSSSSSPPTNPSGNPQNDLAARQKAAAAAIAAKLGKSLPNLPSSSSSGQTISAQALADAQRQREFGESDSEKIRDSDKAAALMANWGYKAGEGLGSEGNKGILEPLSALKAKAEASKKKGNHPNNWSSKSNPQAPARGKIINSNVSERELEEKQRFGEPSEVVLLENMVTEDEVDEELPEEIGEECSKHGIVQRVFIWPGTPNGVRIFVVFSGMVGAWKTVRALDGRYFSGKTTRARYYDKAKFDRGDYLALLD